MTNLAKFIKTALLGKRAPALLALLVAISTFGVQIRHSRAAAGDDKKGANKDPKDDPFYAPPFPAMFQVQGDQPTSRNSIARIVTESISYAGSVTTQEEYIDLETLKHAYVMTDSQEVIYTSAREGFTLKYRPYSCESFKSEEMVLQGIDGLSEVHGELKLRVFGIMGLWLKAARMPKSFERHTVNMGVKDLEKATNWWHFTHPDSDYRIKLQFSQEFILEQAEIMNSNNALLKTIKVISIEYELENYEDILSVPVGFDCAKNFVAEKPSGDDDETSTKDDFWSTYVWTESQVKLEVTATKIGQTGERATDTIYVELAHAFVGDSIVLHGSNGVRNEMHLTKIKSKQQETRTILNHLYDVIYHIDSRSGKCLLNHLQYKSAFSTKGETLEDEARADLVLKFSNGLELPFHKEVIKLLFTPDAGPYQALKRTVRPSWDKAYSVEQVLLERPSFDWPYATKKDEEKMVAHMMLTLERNKDLATNMPSPLKVQSLTIWLLPVARNKILETYHISVVDERAPLEDWPDVASLFDVSEECYLNDPTKKSGLDYAWMELFYPISSRVMDKLIDNEFYLKQAIYNNLMSIPLLSSFNLPRFELMFTDEGLILRLLLLDLPPFEIMFDTWGLDYKLKMIDEAQDKVMRFVLPNQGHCARMCQLHDCNSMSFCTNTNECLIGAESISATSRVGEAKDYLELAKYCTTYSVDRPDLMARLRKRRLANVISVLQNQDYDQLDLPQMPDELTMTREEVDLSDQEITRIANDYVESVTKYFEQTGRRVPALTLTLEVNDHLTVVLPTSFSIENNPLEEFSLNYASGGSDNSDDVELHDPQQIVNFFHAGAPGYRLDPNAVLQHQNDKSHPVRTFRSLPGLTYDQCALACLDSKCGVFSHCEHSNDCVVSELKNMAEAHEYQAMRGDRDCLVSQRDYAQHFQKFDNVQEPEKSERAMHPVVTVNDCAANCVTEIDFNCFSFEVCKSGGADGKLMCYLHDHRRADSMELYGAGKNDTSSTKSKIQCDHYERSYLAEFTAIELHAIKQEQLVKLKTTEYLGKTTFECAEICLNQLTDCSAFEFCFQANEPDTQKTTSFAQSCTMIQSKPEDEKAQKGSEYIVEDDRPDSIFLRNEMSLKPDSGLLQRSPRCHVFALKPNTIQAHLRSLALGQTMTRHEKAEQERHRAEAGSVFSWAGLFLFVLSLAVLSGLAGFGLCWARERSGLVRHHMDRAQAALSRPLSRFRS